MRSKQICIFAEDNCIKFYKENDCFVYEIAFNILKKIIIYISKISKLNEEATIEQKEYKSLEDEFKQILLDLGFEVRE